VDTVPDGVVGVVVEVDGEVGEPLALLPHPAAAIAATATAAPSDTDSVRGVFSAMA